MARAVRHQTSYGFERIAATVAALIVIGLSVFLLIRNEEIADPRLFFVLRVVLSFSAAVLGACIPGFLEVGWSGGGLAVRAGGALALFVLTFVFTPDTLGAAENAPTGSTQPNAPGGQQFNNAPGGTQQNAPGGQQFNNAPGGTQYNAPGAGGTINVNPDPAKRSCRDPSHGIERYQRTFVVTRRSGEMGGGYSQPWWCGEATEKLRGEYPGADIQKVSSSESTRNHCPPFNCPQYTYSCTLNVQADPIYFDKVSPACR